MPGILDSVDEDGFNAELQDQLDVPRRVLLSPDAVKQKRAAREQANQQAQMAQVGPAMAKSAKDLAQAQQTGLTLDI
jgi:ABC-type branched-subunit amino acid transport system ATPase component